MIEVPSIECVAGRGIRGDRYFDFKDDYKGQITFFSRGGLTKGGLLRVSGRNVLASAASVGSEKPVPTFPTKCRSLPRYFEVQGVRFRGTEESRPCDWMNRAIGPGAREFLKGRGGLRAKILTDGVLRSTARIPAAAE